MSVDIDFVPIYSYSEVLQSNNGYASWEITNHVANLSRVTNIGWAIHEC